MATNETLNFISASELVIYQDGDDPYFAGSKPTLDGAGFSEWYAFDFVGLNIGIVDPVSSSDNIVGYPAAAAVTNYINRPVGYGVSGHNDLMSLTSDAAAQTLNPLLHHRNGPYGHPTWKQIRGGQHPVARHFRLNNTMSVDLQWPVDPIYRESLRRERREQQENYNFIEYDIYQEDQNIILSNPVYSDYFSPKLHQYYEPVLTTKHKPLEFKATIPGGGPIRVRTSFMNKMMDFSSDDLNKDLRFSSGIPASALPLGGGIPWKRTNQKYYNIFRMAKATGATLFIYSERLYPREINSYRAFKTKRPNYEEAPGTGHNGYDRALHRLFWKDTQGGDTSTTITSSATSDGTTRLRTVGTALSSVETLQNMNFSSTTLEFLTGSALIYGSSATASLVDGISNLLVNSITNGVVTDRYYHAHASGVIDQKDAHQPYPISLLSSWPLDARDDIYDKPDYLTSSIGGKGLQIGLTPHKGGHYDIVDMDDNLIGSNTLYNTIRHSGQTAISASSVIQAAVNLHTGSAGELVYSTKPTIFYAEGTDHKFVTGGYKAPTASLQYNRHTYPYNTPFYVTNRVRGRNPFYKSYDDFVSQLKYLGRDYSIVPEYRYSDHMDYYNTTYGTTLSAPNKLLFKEAIFDTEALGGDIAHLGNKLVRAVSFMDWSDSIENPPSEELLEIYKASFLILDGADVTSSANATGSYLKTTDRYKYNDISGATAVTPPGFTPSIYTYLGDKTSVDFDGKYATTDSTINFSNLLEIPEGFTEGQDSIPRSVKFKCSIIKKLLPYNGFYPVTRTTQIGNAFKKEFVAASGYTGSMTETPSGFYSCEDQAYLQALLEPFMAPGVLYNSIKSGIAVDYPIYTASMGASDAAAAASRPNYHVPRPFISSSADGSILPLREAGPHHHALSSSYHGGLHMLGASHCIPSILTSFYGARFPFRYLYNLDELELQFGGDTRPSIHLVSDFVDLNRFTQTCTVPGGDCTDSMSGSILIGDPSVTLPDAAGFTQLRHGKYFSMINNYLSETMEFFLADVTSFNTKLPIVTTSPFDSGPNPVSPITPQSKEYLMEVSLRMGKYQVMCEGPRQAGIGDPDSNLFDQAGTDQGFWLRNSSMRGYIYGPPMEIIPANAPGASGNDTWYPNSAVAMKDAVIQDIDYSSYFAANLQDPAYHAYTPPYFYGKSSMIYKFSAEESDNISLPNLVNKMAIAGVTGSYYVNTYDTPTYNFTTPKKGQVIANESLSLTTPATDSTSGGARAKMKIDASLGGIEGLMGLYSSPIEVANSEAGEGTHNSALHVWTIAPEWICPVLDFEQDRAAVRNHDNTFSFIENSFHDVTTGRGMWGGYGTDPYDSFLMNKVGGAGFTSSGKKGIYIEINDFLLEPTTNKKEAPIDKDSTSGFYDLLDIKKGAATGSLSRLLGIQPENTRTSFPVGKFASGKKIHEAIILIPYIDKPIRLPLDPEVTYSQQHIHGTLHHDERLYYATREIIPGKHFLPINEEIFVNTLHFHLLEATKQTHLNKFWTGGGYSGPYSPSTIEKWALVRSLAAETDVGKMISRLSSFNSVHGGFQLPPEFDFIHNASVPPFQMIVVPFEHTLKKQELIDIYQGIMPDSSLTTKKDASCISSLEIHPTRVPPLNQIAGGALLDVDYIPEFASTETNAAGILDAGHSAALTGFLSPLPFVDPPKASFTAGQPTMDITTMTGASLPYKTSAKFYKNLRFMVFKIKQRAKKDYSNYRKGQIIKAVNSRINDVPTPGEGNGYQFITDANYNYISKNKTVGDVFGANWPYDYFSLIQSLKVDITFSDN